jgi:hypothetical protein
MSLLNNVLGTVFDALLRPLAALPALGSLAIVSLATAIAMLLVVRATSNQPALEAVKRQIHAALFEIRLFNDDLRAIFRAQKEILRHNATYLRLLLVPMAWMIAPLVLLTAQLQFRYGYEGLDAGRPVLLTAHLRSSERARLEAPPGIRVESDAIWFPAAKEMTWRIVPESQGDHILALHVGNEVFTKTIHVSHGLARRSPKRLSAGFLNEVLYPAEAPLPARGPVDAIRVAYPECDLDVFGWKLNWMLVFVVLSIVFAFVFRKPFAVKL